MRKLRALVLLVGAAACGLDTATGPLVGDISGTYSLQTMSGNPLPFTLVSHDTTIVIDSDVLVLTSTGDWSETVSYRQTVGTAATTNESLPLSGFWTRAGNQLNFRTTQGLLYIGTASETALTLSDNSFTYVFTR
ncbi:MAG TPA: hypothetical protein VFI52_11685 [Gemmatimonadaceae bacterium]|nr:hypothetical protein [Gemmatimonadaceae bacterium]